MTRRTTTRVTAALAAVAALGLALSACSSGGAFEDAEADTVDRYIHPAADYGKLSAAVARAFPGLDPTPAKAIACMVTNSPDRQFVIGHPGGDTRVVVAGGDSGHGFKHAPAIGELLAQLAVGDEPFTDIAFMSPDRAYDGTSWLDEDVHAATRADDRLTVPS